MIWRTGRHNPTKNGKEYPLLCSHGVLWLCGMFYELFVKTNCSSGCKHDDLILVRLPVSFSVIWSISYLSVLNILWKKQLLHWNKHPQLQVEYYESCKKQYWVDKNYIHLSYDYKTFFLIGRQRPDKSFIWNQQKQEPIGSWQKLIYEMTIYVTCKYKIVTKKKKKQTTLWR